MHSKKWIESAGGPLILLPRGLLAEWTGSDGDDYGRACTVTDYIETLEVAWGQGLVLGDTPDSTAVIDTGKGVALLRWLSADSEEQILSTVYATFDAARRLETLDFHVTEEEHILFDSACPGVEFGDALPVRFEPGSYEVQTLELVGEPVSYLLHLFQKKANQPSQPMRAKGPHG